jgi:hypothetical protein
LDLENLVGKLESGNFGKETLKFERFEKVYFPYSR